MATKVINTYYTGNVRQDGSNNYLTVNFATKGDLKLWLSQITGSFSSPTHIIVELNKVEVTWDDSTKYIASTVTPISAGDL